MEIKIKYNSKEDRQAQVKEQEASKNRMLFDDFDMAWLNKTCKNMGLTQGQVIQLINEGKIKPHGVLTFTDEPEPIVIDPIKEEYAKATATRKQQMIAERLGLA